KRKPFSTLRESDVTPVMSTSPAAPEASSLKSVISFSFMVLPNPGSVAQFPLPIAEVHESVVYRISGSDLCSCWRKFLFKIGLYPQKGGRASNNVCNHRGGIKTSRCAVLTFFGFWLIDDRQ